MEAESEISHEEWRQTAPVKVCDVHVVVARNRGGLGRLVPHDVPADSTCVQRHGGFVESHGAVACQHPKGALGAANRTSSPIDSSSSKYEWSSDSCGTTDKSASMNSSPRSRPFFSTSRSRGALRRWPFRLAKTYCGRPTTRASASCGKICWCPGVLRAGCGGVQVPLGLLVNLSVTSWRQCFIASAIETSAEVDVVGVYYLLPRRTACTRQRATPRHPP
jgi:hypothetical protein